MMSPELSESVAYLDALAGRALAVAYAIPLSADDQAWVEVCLSAVHAQAQVLVQLVGVTPLTRRGRNVDGVTSSARCLDAMADELMTWEWDRLDRTVLSAGAQLALDVDDAAQQLTSMCTEISWDRFPSRRSSQAFKAPTGEDLRTRGGSVGPSTTEPAGDVPSRSSVCPLDYVPAIPEKALATVSPSISSLVRSDEVETVIRVLTSVADAGQRRDEAGNYFPIDFPVIVSHVLAAVAANMGGIDWIIEGEPETRESELVCQLVHCAAGEAPLSLLHHRREPLRIVLDVAELFCDFGIYDLYQEAVDILGGRLALAEDAVLSAFASVEERNQIADLNAKVRRLWLNPPFDRERAVDLSLEAMRVRQVIADRTSPEHPLVKARATVWCDCEVLDDLWEQDMDTYVVLYEQAVREAIRCCGINLPVEVVRQAPWDKPFEWDTIANELDTHARLVAPLPMTGQVPNWSDGLPANTLRRTGLTYIDRVTRSTP